MLRFHGFHGSICSKGIVLQQFQKCSNSWNSVGTTPLELWNLGTMEPLFI